MEMSGQLHAPASLLSRKESLVPIGQEAWWAPEPTWPFWRRRKNLLPLLENVQKPSSAKCNASLSELFINHLSL
jgi:hypothetical protein